MLAVVLFAPVAIAITCVVGLLFVVLASAVMAAERRSQPILETNYTPSHARTYDGVSDKRVRLPLLNVE